MTAKKTATTNTATARRRTTGAKQTATSAPAVAGGAARRAKAQAGGGRGKVHPVIEQLSAAIIAAAEHLRGPEWKYASFVLTPPNAGAVDAPPPVVLTVQNPVHATTPDG